MHISIKSEGGFKLKNKAGEFKKLLSPFRAIVQIHYRNRGVCELRDLGVRFLFRIQMRKLK